MARCAFIGLGVMGYPMAGYLAQAGHEVTVYNRTAEKAARWCADFTGVSISDLSRIGTHADFIFTCVGNDDDMRHVIEQALISAKPDTIFIDHTTCSANVTHAMAQKLADKSCHLLDAPVSGGEIGAQKGALTIMVGGAEAIYEKAAPLMACYARAVKLMGASGAGQLTKMVNQICIAGLLQSLSEAILFGERAGLNIEAVIDVISQGAAQSWQMDNRALTMHADKFDFGFAVDWMRKDLDICLTHAKTLNTPLPITQIINDYYSEIQTMGGGRWDTSALIAHLRKSLTTDT